jgi:hypothetical protein
VTQSLRIHWPALVVLAALTTLYGGDKKDKPKTADAQTVDSGSFGVFVKGERVVTETFSVHQESGISIVKSQLQAGGGSSAVQQHSELRMTGAGELVHYEWSDAGSSLSVMPNNEFLLEKIVTSSSKAAEQPFLMPNTSAILDNNFFVHREILVWRYLAADCQNEKGSMKCSQGPVEFGVLVPQDRTSMRVRLELVGREKVPIHGAERELLRLNLKGDTFSWALWVDENDHFKLVRVVIADANTEAVRD